VRIDIRTYFRDSNRPDFWFGIKSVTPLGDSPKIYVRNAVANMTSAVPLLQDDADGEEQPSALSVTFHSDELCVGQTPWSNVFFLAGSGFYVWIAVWDLTSPLVDTFIQEENNSLIFNTTWSLYDFVTITAPFMYVLNAVMEFQGAVSEKMHWELAVAIIFGMAALMDMVGTLFYGSGSYRLDNLPFCMAVHFYLIQAILAVWQGSSFYENQIANALQQGGYLLFLVGSIIDVAISYMDASMDMPTRRIQVWSLVSSLLWLMDAILYLVAHFVEQYHRPRGYDLTSG
jgi:hypothetical protein